MPLRYIALRFSPRQGCLLQVAPRGDTSPYTFKTFADVRSIRGPTGQTEQIDVTSHSSPSGSKEFIAGPRDYGTLTFTINFNPSDNTHKDRDGLAVTTTETDGLLYQFRTGTTYHYRLQFPQTSPDTQWEFDGFVQGFEVNLPVDDAMTADVTIKVSGVPDFAA